MENESDAVTRGAEAALTSGAASTSTGWSCADEIGLRSDDWCAASGFMQAMGASSAGDCSLTDAGYEEPFDVA